MPVKMDGNIITNFSEYIPVGFDHAKATVQWLYAGNKTFDEPFFEDSIRIMKHDQPAKYTTLQKLIDVGRHSLSHAIKPTAFVFHTSRCGSTLVTQMLARSARNIVYSEPPLLDDILNADMADDHKVEALRAALIMMGQKRKTVHEYLFIKWDSWHLADYELIRCAFPDIEAMFLYREPLEILKSHHHSRGIHMVPGLLKKDFFRINNIPAWDLDRYAAAVLLKFYEWMIKHSHDNYVRLVNYNDLPEHFFHIITEFGLKYTPQELGAMLERSKRHSKHPNEIHQGKFEEEKIIRLEALASTIRAAYERLEAIKKYPLNVD